MSNRKRDIIAGVSILVISLLVAEWIAGLIIPIPKGTFTFSGDAAVREIHRDRLHYWIGLAIWITAVFALEFGYRRWRKRHGGQH